MDITSQFFYKLIEKVCEEPNRDIAGIHWMIAGELVSDLNITNRKLMLETELGKEIQLNLWQLYQRSSLVYQELDVEHLLMFVVNDDLIEHILNQNVLGVRDIHLLGKVGSEKAVKHLITIANSSGSDLHRLEAIKALGTAGTSEAVNTLKQLLDDEAVRDTVLRSLGRANTAQSARILIEYAGYDTPFNFKEAIALLTNPAIEKELLTDVSINSPLEQLRVLGQVGGEASVTRLTEIIKQAVNNFHNNDYSELIKTGIVALGKISTASAAKALTALIKEYNPDDFYPDEVIEALGAMNIPAAWDSLGEIMVDGTVELSLRREACRNLAYSLPDLVETRLIDLRDTITDIDELPVLIAITLKGSHTRQSALLLEELLQSSRDEVQEEAVTSLAERHEYQSVGAIIQALHRRLPQAGSVTNRLIWALGEIGNPRAIPVLLNILADNQYNAVWKVVVQALDKVADSRATPELIEFADKIRRMPNRKDLYPEVATVLAKTGDPQGIIYLLDWIGKADAPADPTLIARKIHSEPAIKPLVEVGLVSSLAIIREVSIIALGSIGTQQVIPALLKGLQDDKEDVIIAAEKALEHQIQWFDDEQIAGQILKAIINPDIPRRYSAIECLKKADEKIAPVICPQLLDWLEDMPSVLIEERWRIIEVLGELRCTSASQLIAELLLKGNNQEIRSLAAKMLGNIGSDEAGDCLVQALRSEKDSLVRDTITESLTQVQYLCKLLDYYPETHTILQELSLRYSIRIFADGRVSLPESSPEPCHEAMAKMP